MASEWEYRLKGSEYCRCIVQNPMGVYQFALCVLIWSPSRECFGLDNHLVESRGTLPVGNQWQER